MASCRIAGGMLLNVAKPIPETTMRHYLGGIAALNLPSVSGSGDWHLEQTFFRGSRRTKGFLSGDGCDVDTASLLGERGIYECSAALQGLGIPYRGEVAYAASHARAIVDLLIAAVRHAGRTDHVRLDDWMPTPEGKSEVFEMLHIALPKLPIDHQAKLRDWHSRNVGASD